MYILTTVCKLPSRSILALTETWLGSVVDNHVIVQLVPDGYMFHTVSRPAQKCGGGVAVIYKSGFKVETRNKFTHFEHGDYYVTARGVTSRLGVAYRPPVSKRNGVINSVFSDQWSAYSMSCGSSITASVI